jgi:hypothetical protein
MIDDLNSGQRSALFIVIKHRNILLAVEKTSLSVLLGSIYIVLPFVMDSSGPVYPERKAFLTALFVVPTDNFSLEVCAVRIDSDHFITSDTDHDESAYRLW